MDGWMDELANRLITEVMTLTPELMSPVGRSVQDGSRSALHRVGAAISGPLPEPAGGPAQREEDAAVLPRVPAHCSSAGLLGHRPAQNQDGHFLTQVHIRAPATDTVSIFISREGADVQTTICLLFTGSGCTTSST